MITRTYRNAHNARISSRGREVLILIIAIIIGMIASLVSNILEDTSYDQPTKSAQTSTFISQVQD